MIPLIVGATDNFVALDSGRPNKIVMGKEISVKGTQSRDQCNKECKRPIVH